MGPILSSSVPERGCSSVPERNNISKEHAWSKRVTISNGNDEVVYVAVTHKSLERSPFLEKGHDWYSHARYFQRIGRGDSLSIDLEFSPSENLFYITLGLESGTQIADGLSKNLTVKNVIVSQNGTVTNARDDSKWVDEDGVSHKPSGERKMRTDPTKEPQPANFIQYQADLKKPGDPGVKMSVATSA